MEKSTSQQQQVVEEQQPVKIVTDTQPQEAPSMEERYLACMVLSAVGDQMGYKWEFDFSGPRIHAEVSVEQRTGGKGVLALDISRWCVSDDTVMHLATAEALVTGLEGEALCKKIASRYHIRWDQMPGRAPGGTCSWGVHRCDSEGNGWDKIPASNSGGGCGAAMRSMCIGLFYWREEQLPQLIQIAVESGRTTHHHPTGFMGSVASALFTAFAVRRVPIVEWGWRLLETVESVKRYIEEVGRDAEWNLQNFDYFVAAWEKYLKKRHIRRADLEKRAPQHLTDTSAVVFPKVWGVKERDAFYKQVSWQGWGGASGHDAPLIAYDALLFSRDDWKTFCESCILHAGDNDSTGAIGGAWWGALFGYRGVPENHWRRVEWYDRETDLGLKIYKIAQQGKSPSELGGRKLSK